VYVIYNVHGGPKQSKITLSLFVMSQLQR